MPTTSFTDAISAYRAAARAAVGTKPPVEAAETVGTGASFADMVKDTVKGAIDSGRKAENLEMKAIAGQADLRDVVMAVANAEVTLDTVVAIRDKVVGAYNEILKMPM
ncbi:MAG: flagellar hook-basal body complex protein FliE [Rhodospirillaceae bacterium]|nr:MAG: flagellar hook-basal body complex protein FliE [Rhodospirillaceae bacterium]